MKTIQKSKQKRNTIQRTKIIQYLKSVRNHPTAEMVYEALSKELPMLTLATVYRNLNLLADEGQILRFKYKNTYRFDGNSKHHYHIVCTKCGEIFDAESNRYDDFIKKEIDELKNKGFEIQTYNLIFYGLCNKCKKGE